MSAPSDRRGFLRGLATLPLIGGGVTLIGRPTAAAEPVTDRLIEQYVAWLAHEHRAALVEQARRRAEGSVAKLVRSGGTPLPGYVASVERDIHDNLHMLWFPDTPAIQASVASAAPSTRAAIVLSAVGCDWRRP